MCSFAIDFDHNNNNAFCLLMSSGGRQGNVCKESFKSEQKRFPFNQGSSMHWAELDSFIGSGA